MVQDLESHVGMTGLLIFFSEWISSLQKQTQTYGWQMDLARSAVPMLTVERGHASMGPQVLLPGDSSDTESELDIILQESRYVYLVMNQMRSMI